MPGSARVVLRVTLLRGVGVLAAGEEGHRNSGAGASGLNRYARRRRAHSRGIPACPGHPYTDVLFSRHKTQLPTPRRPCRVAPTPASTFPETHAVLGTRIKPPFPEGLETAFFALGCFWGAERLFWETRRRLHDRGRLQDGTTPNPTYEEVCTRQDRARRGGAGRLRPGKISYADLLKVFFEEHDPTQGMRQGNDVGTQYRSASTSPTTPRRRRRRRRGDAYDADLRAAGNGAGHDRDRAGRAVLLRRGLPPAVPAQGPERLLRPGRHRRLLPGRALRLRPPGAHRRLTPAAIDSAVTLRKERWAGWVRAACPPPVRERVSACRAPP